MMEHLIDVEEAAEDFRCNVSLASWCKPVGRKVVNLENNGFGRLRSATFRHRHRKKSYGQALGACCCLDLKAWVFLLPDSPGFCQGRASRRLAT